MGHFILRLPGNREDSLIIPTRALTEDSDAIFSLLSTDAHTGVNQDGIKDTKDNDDDDDDAVTDDINEPDSLSST